MPVFCNLDADRARRLTIGIIFAIIMFFFFASFCAVVDAINSASAASNSPSFSLKISGSFFICMVVIPILVIEGDTEGRVPCHPKRFEEDSDSPMGKFCGIWQYVFAAIALLGGFLYWVGGFVAAGGNNSLAGAVTFVAVASPSQGVIEFTLPTYVMFQTVVVVMDFLNIREIMKDRRFRLMILLSGMFLFALLVFSGAASLSGAIGAAFAANNVANPYAMLSAGTFFLWLFTLIALVPLVVTIGFVEDNKRMFDLVVGGCIFLGGFLTFVGFCMLADYIRSVLAAFAALATALGGNGDFLLRAASAQAFFYGTWGLFILCESCIITYDMICVHGLFQIEDAGIPNAMEAQQDGGAASAPPASDGTYGNAAMDGDQAGDGDVITSPHENPMGQAHDERPPPPPPSGGYGGGAPPPAVPR